MSKIYVIKQNDGDWSVYEDDDFLKDLLDDDVLPEWFEGARVQIVEFKPTLKMVSPLNVGATLEKL